MNIANMVMPIFSGVSRFLCHMNAGDIERLLIDLWWFFRFIIQTNTENMGMLVI